MKTRFVAYDRLGARRGVITDPLDASLTSTLNELSVLTLHYARSGLNSSMLDNAPELAVEWFNGSTWVELRDARLRSLTVDFDHLEDVPTRRYDFIGIGEALKGVLVYGAYGLPVNKDGHPQFKVSNAGRILATIWDNAVGRGWTGFSRSFSPTTDSNGAPWAQNFTISYSVDQNLLNILQQLVAQGLVDFYWQGRTLHVYNAGTYLARDMSVGTTPIKFDGGLTGIDAAPEMEDVSNLATHVVVLGENKLRWEFPTTTIIPEGRREIVLSYSGVDDIGTAQILANPHILRAQNYLKNTTRQFHLSDDTVMHPHEDYLVGDWVKVLRGTTYERMRIYSINLQRNANGLQGFIQLGDRVDDLLEIMYARIQGLTGGVANEGGTPPPATGRIPEAPTGLVVSSDAYIDKNGLTQGTLAMTWAHSGQDTNGESIVINEYIVYYRASTETAWRFLTTSSVTNATASPLTVYDGNGDLITYQIRVVAVSGTGLRSASSSTVNVLMDADTTAPNRPYFQQANVTTWLMTVKVTWDGTLTTTGSNHLSPPPDFERIEVFQDTQASMATEVKIGEIYGQWDFANVPAAVAGQTLYFRMYAIDRSQNRSTPSDVKSITPQANVDISKITAVIDAAAVQITNAGNLVISTGNTLSAKLSAQDGLISTANTNISGLQTNYTTQSGQITALQTTVSGKNKIVRNTGNATGTTDYVNGDRWEKWSTLSAGGKLQATWRFNGTSWIAEEIDPIYIPQVDIGSGTFGNFDGGRITVGSLKTSAFAVSDLVNFAPSPAESPGDWTLSGGMTIVTTALDDSGKRFSVADNGAIAYARGPFMAVKPAQVLYGYAKIFRGTGVQNLYVRYYFYDKDKVEHATTPFINVPNGNNAGGSGSVLDGAVTVPAGTAFARYTLVASATAGTAGFYLVDGFRQSSTVQIQGGAITANEINASSVGAAVGAFVKLDVKDLVVTGTGNMNSAVITELYTAVVRSKRVIADMMVVGRGVNGLVDEYFDQADTKAYRHTLAGSWGSYGVSGANSLNTYGNGSLTPGTARTFYFDTQAPTYSKDHYIPVEPGQKWRFSVMYTSGTSGPRAGVRIIRRDGTTAFTTIGGGMAKRDGTSNVYDPAGTLATMERVYTVPADVAFVSPAIQFESTCTSATVYGGATFTNMATASLIADGAVTARTLTVTEEMWTNILHFKKLSGDEIDANLLTSDVAWIGTLRGGILINDSVDTGMLKADAITAKHTLTGPTIQTIATANRGIKLTSSSLKAWNTTTSINTFTLDAATGDVLVSTLSTSASGARVKVWDNFAGRAQADFYTDTSGQHGSIYTEPQAGNGGYVTNVMHYTGTPTTASNWTARLTLFADETWALGSRTAVAQITGDGSGQIFMRGKMIKNNGAATTTETFLVGTTVAQSNATGSISITYAAPVPSGTRTVIATADSASVAQIATQSTTGSGVTFLYSTTASSNLTVRFLSVWTT